MRFSLARIMTHPQSHHGQPPTTIQVGKKRAKQAGKVRIPKWTLRKSSACSDECFNPFKMDDEVESNGEEVEDDEDDEDDDEEDKIRRFDLDEESE
jgi:ferredoxin